MIMFILAALSAGIIIGERLGSGSARRRIVHDMANRIAFSPSFRADLRATLDKTEPPPRLR